MPSQVNFTVRDRSDEYSSVQFNIDDVEADNFASVQTQMDAVRTALEALTTGNVARESLVAINRLVDDTRPLNPYAQRELGLRLFYQDTVTQKKFHITVPAPDLLLVGSGGTDEVDLSGVSVVNAIVTALEAFMLTPDGNGAAFYRGVLVGRRS